MMTLYTSTTLARDTVAILYYSIVLSSITVVVAICIGTIQLLSLASNFTPLPGVDKIGDNYDIVGGSICAAFIVFGGLSVILYKPWRRAMARRQETISGGEPQTVNKKIDGPEDPLVSKTVVERPVENTAIDVV